MIPVYDFYSQLIGRIYRLPPMEDGLVTVSMEVPWKGFEEVYLAWGFGPNGPALFTDQVDWMRFHPYFVPDPPDA